MNFLLDTGVFLWARTTPERLHRRAREVRTKERDGLHLSAASVWEVGVKYQLGKLPLPEPPGLYVPASMNLWGIHALDITHRHALSAAELPLHHPDPFDRILIAQAKTEGMVLLTADRMFEKYPVDLLWCGR
jgi:PIN domain nuclease of toxin-antitoxin system